MALGAVTRYDYDAADMLCSVTDALAIISGTLLKMEKIKMKKAVIILLVLAISVFLCGCPSKTKTKEMEMSPQFQPETYWMSEDKTFMFHVDANYNDFGIIYTGTEIVNVCLYMDWSMNSFKVCNRDDFNAETGRVESVEYFEKGKYKIISDSEFTFTFNETMFFDTGDQLTFHKVNQWEYESVLDSIGTVDDYKTILGISDIASYHNDFFNFTLEWNAEQYAFSNEEINTLRGYSTEQLSNQELFEALSSPAGVPVLNVKSVDGSSVFSVTIQRNLNSTEEEYIKESRDNLPAAFEGAGMSCESVEIVSIDFAGEEHPAVTIHASCNGVDLYETLVAVKRGNCYAVVAATCYGEDDTLELLNSLW